MFVAERENAHRHSRKIWADSNNTLKEADAFYSWNAATVISPRRI